MGFLEERNLTDLPAIPEFYKGKSIFITGGSGFMGKVLFEKLLYSCSELDKIYLLIRSKKGISPADRLQKMYSIPCFDRLRKDRPGIFESKVVAVAGDVSEVGLGLSTEDRELLIKNVNIIFNIAASLRFDNPLPVSANMNIRSAVEVIEIAKEMKNLNVFVHVSTAYSNTQWNPIEEKIYPAYADWRETLNICENLDEKTINIMASKYMGDIPNAYIFTKQLAEHAVYEQKGKLPIVIVRPSMVISSVKEPVPGWVENFNGPVGVFTGAGKGILRCLHSREDFSADYAPVDICIRHFIVASWIRGTQKLAPSDDIEIYNCCSMEKISNSFLISSGKEIVAEIPLERSLWTINCTFHTSSFMYYINVFIRHLIPALLVDMMLWIYGKKPMLLKMQRKIFISNLVFQKYINYEWDFALNNFFKLRDCLKEEDKQEFYYDFKNFFSKDYFSNCLKASKQFLLNEKLENLPKAKARMERITLADKILRYMTYGAMAWLVINSNFVFNLYQKILLKLNM